MMPQHSRLALNIQPPSGVVIAPRCRWQVGCAVQSAVMTVLLTSAENRLVHDIETFLENMQHHNLRR